MADIDGASRQPRDVPSEPEVGPGAGYHPGFFDGPFHTWFGLSYANYLTVPRTIMQAMPAEWQQKMVDLLDELGDTFDWQPEKFIYYVSAAHYDTGKGDGSLWSEEEGGEPILEPIDSYDPLSDYRHPDFAWLDEINRKKGEESI